MSADGTHVGVLYKVTTQPALALRFDVWDIAGRPPKRVSSADIAEPKEQDVTPWKITSDLAYVGVVGLSLSTDGEIRGYTANVYDATGTRLPLPQIEDGGGIAVDLIGMTADGQAVEVYVSPLPEDLPPDARLEPHHRPRLYRWEKGADEWKRAEVHAPVWKDGQRPDEFAFILTDSYWGHRDVPTPAGRRLFVSHR